MATIKAKQLDTGTTANKVVVLDSNAKLPAVAGDNLTGLPGLNTHSDVNAASPSAGQVLTWNNGGYWEPDDPAAPAGALVYKGSYDVASSTTTGLLNAVKGDFYVASTEGSLGGLLVRKGDHIVLNADMGGSFSKLKVDLIDNTGPYQEYLGLSNSTAITAKAGYFYAFGSITNTSMELILPDSATLATGDTFKIVNNRTAQNDGTLTVTITGGTGKPGLSGNNPVEIIYFSAGSASSANIQVKGQALTFIYDQSTNFFYLQTGTRFLEALVDVDTTTSPPSNGDFLKYNGTKWIPQTPTFISDINSESLGDLSDVNTASAADGYILEYSSGQWSAAPASSGASRPNVYTQTSTFTIGDGTGTDPGAIVSSELERIYLINNSSTAVTITLPAISGSVGSGFKLQIKRLGTANVTVSQNGTETIDGQNTQLLGNQYANITLVCDGSNWFIV